MEFFTITSLIGFTATFLLGAYIILNNRQSSLNIYFGLFFLSASFWCLTAFLTVTGMTREQAYFWAKAQNVVSILLPIFFYRFTMIFLVIKKRTWPWRLIWLFIFWAAGLAFFVNTPWLTKDVGPRLNFEYWPIAGSLNWMLLAYVFTVFAFSFYFYARLRRFFTGLKREQIDLLLWGLVPAFLGGLSVALIDFGINIPPIGNLFIPLYIVLLFVKMLFIKERKIDDDDEEDWRRLRKNT